MNERTIRILHGIIFLVVFIVGIITLGISGYLVSELVGTADPRSGTTTSTGTRRSTMRRTATASASRSSRACGRVSLRVSAFRKERLSLPRS